MSGTIRVPPPANEPVLSYAPGTPERAALKARLAELSARSIEIPLIIGGEEIRTGRTSTAVMPHDHRHTLATWHMAGPAEVKLAIEAARDAWTTWSTTPWEDRAAVFLRAAELLSTTWRATVNAATMLGQSKTAHQAEIDSACELIDFYRFNAWFAERIHDEQPISSTGVWNRSEYRPLEGFVYAVTPFNFTAIAGNLCAAPALMGNVVLWKPSASAIYSAYHLMRLLEAAGLPPGVVNFIPGESAAVTGALIDHADFAGLHYTGSTRVFQDLWRTIGANLTAYRGYPRIVGETGGKDFIVAHPSADPEALRTAIVRGGFEYQGQKCSAASRVYIPEGVWARMGADLVAEVDALPVGDVRDFRNFMGAVINESAFRSQAGYIERARKAPGVELLAGGTVDDSRGWFVRPTVIRVEDPRYESMCEEIFGPVVSVHVYPDRRWEETLELVDSTSPYALTGAVFANERAVVRHAMDRLRHAAGNFYVNDKPTGAVVGQQPFGGGRASGTNDKAGSAMNLLRWVSARSIKETLAPPTESRYPFMDAE
jgi:1-pyrroline-5-carboxylate dehydrogenase